ncbi:MAG: hypothetical protein RQ826_07355 [Xanthomonadales bacterium]|nr:hypothetical protein [Xanthomonadales bacterium]
MSTTTSFLKLVKTLALIPDNRYERVIRKHGRSMRAFQLDAGQTIAQSVVHTQENFANNLAAGGLSGSQIAAQPDSTPSSGTPMPCSG